MTQSNLKTTSSKHTSAARSRGPYPTAGGSGCPTFTCHCGKVVRRKDKLRHEESHLDDSQRTWVNCPFDGCTYRVSPRQLTNMYAHARAKHTHELLTCAECSWSTTQSSSFSRHYKDRHPGIPTPRCPHPTMPEFWLIENGLESTSGSERSVAASSSPPSSTENHPVTAGEPYPALDFSTLTTLPWTPSPSPPFYIGDFFQIPPGFQSMPSPTSSSSSLDPLQDPIFSFVPPANLPPFDFNSFFIPSAWSPLQDPNWPFRFAGSERSMLFQAPDSSDITFLTYNPGQETTNYSPFGCGVPNGSGWMGPFQ